MEKRGKPKLAVFVMAEETMILREVARRLAIIKNAKATGVDVDKLHSLLRLGELLAGFYLMGGTVWIDVPVAHWEVISSAKMRKITRKPNEPKSGSYKLRASKFPDQVASVICKQVEAKEETPNQDLTKSGLVTAVIVAADKSYEVTIRTRTFLEYLERHGIQETITAIKPGRPQMNWRGVCRYMVAYTVAHYRDLPALQLKINELSAEIIRRAEVDGVTGLPAADTIKEELSKAMDLLERADFQFKK